MAIGQGYVEQDCALARALEVVGERWTMLIVRDSLFGVRRFSDFEHHLGMSKAVLAQRLSMLIVNGLMERVPAGSREEYVPTSALLGLWPALHALTEWGEQIAPAPGGRRRLFRHAPCGARLDVGGRCPDCAIVPDAADVEMSPGPGVANVPRANAVSRALRSTRKLVDPIR